MKKIILSTLILISLILPIKIYSKNTSDAKELIDTNKLNNITLNYSYDNQEINDVNVKIYFIASISNDFQYKVEDNFKDYNINFNEMKTNEDLNILKDTLESYIKADNIKETENFNIKDNKVEIKNLKAGLYLIETDEINTEKYTLSFEPFLINLPDLNDGYWNYDVNVYPKALASYPNYRTIEYTVIKQWQDNKENRPDKIDIEIYKDGNIVYNETLSLNNNWTFKWKTIDDGSKWNVVERNVPINYNVSILNEDKQFIIINTSNTEENPQTLDNINLYFYLLIGSFIGLISLIIVLILNKKKA